MTTVFGVLFVLALVAFAVWQTGFSPDAQQKRDDRSEQQSRLVCPHCQTAGSVTARVVTRKKGVSGGKATGAVLTGGVSMLATGLSRKERLSSHVTRRHPLRAART
jgi:hypothetical protein